MLTLKQQHTVEPPPMASIDGYGLIDGLYRRYQGDLVRYLRMRFGAELADPEDVAQAAFTRLAAAPALDAVRDQRAYLFTLACNIAIDQRRQTARRSRIDDDLSNHAQAISAKAASAERILLGRERLALIERALATMPKVRRRVFLLVRVEGLAPREVARRFGIGESAVYKHVSRALVDCAQVMEARGHRVGG